MRRGGEGKGRGSQVECNGWDEASDWLVCVMFLSPYVTGSKAEPKEQARKAPRHFHCGSGQWAILLSTSYLTTANHELHLDLHFSFRVHQTTNTFQESVLLLFPSILYTFCNSENVTQKSELQLRGIPRSSHCPINSSGAVRIPPCFLKGIHRK